MNGKQFGGNWVQTWNDSDSSMVFETSPYHYGIYRVSEGSNPKIPELGSITVFVFDLPEGVSANIEGRAISTGDAVQIENGNLSGLKVLGGIARFIVAGVKKSTSSNKSVSVTPFDQIKKVSKPWGHELWINGEHPGYALKQIFIRGPHKTSLQYHNFKQETNVLFEGSARLHYKKTETPNDEVTASDIDTVDMTPLSSVSMVAKVIHRVEAVTDVVLYETSTPYLDDVVRVSDDTARPNGRIDTEHRI